jgi:pSer/pThr/pTyr-binding forkhead associated (FHA) protein
MSDPPDPRQAAAGVTLELLDPASSLPIQSWSFPDRPLIRIGRAEENDVVIVHPFVSRFHAQLQFRDADWQVVNLGTNGTLIRNQKVAWSPLVAGSIFQLGPQGPRLRFHPAPLLAGSSSTQLEAEPVVNPGVRIDEAKKAQEVSAIADSDYFRRLQQQVAVLRGRRGGGPANEAAEQPV